MTIHFDAVILLNADIRCSQIQALAIGCSACVNVGCVPSKALIRAAESLHNAAASKRFDGIEASASVTDWSAVVAQKQALVDELRQAKYVDVLPSYNTIAYKEGKASFTENGDLTVDGELLDVGKIIIATGSQPHIPANIANAGSSTTSR